MLYPSGPQHHPLPRGRWTKTVLRHCRIVAPDAPAISRVASTFSNRSQKDHERRDRDVAMAFGCGPSAWSFLRSMRCSSWNSFACHVIFTTSSVTRRQRATTRKTASLSTPHLYPSHRLISRFIRITSTFIPYRQIQTEYTNHYTHSNFHTATSHAPPQNHRDNNHKRRHHRVRRRPSAPARTASPRAASRARKLRETAAIPVV